jgi:hypothetical protein
MADVLKILSQEVTVNTTPKTISNASLVRLLNSNTTANYLITHRDASNNIIGTFTLPFAGSDESVVYLMKEPTDTVEANNSTYVFGASAGFY